MPDFDGCQQLSQSQFPVFHKDVLRINKLFQVITIPLIVVFVLCFYSLHSVGTDLTQNLLRERQSAFYYPTHHRKKLRCTQVKRHIL